MTNDYAGKISGTYANALNFSDVFIIPRYSNLSTRKHVNISTEVGEYKVPVPVITANMESVTDVNMAKAVRKAGGLAALHRFGSIDDAVTDYCSVASDKVDLPVFVSVGVNRDSEKRVKKLLQCGARYFIIDIAHGHSEHMISMIRFIKSFNDTFVMAGNVATNQAAYDLCAAGADAIKCGVGPGAACTTKNVTGVTVPQVSCILECRRGVSIYNAQLSQNRVDKKYNLEDPNTVRNDAILVADGGIREIGDIAKALAVGADLVMCGKMFAGCDEAPGKGIYRGSASQDVQKLYRTDKSSMPTPEGTSMSVELVGPAADVVEHIAGGLRSAFSYVGAKNLKEFQKVSQIGYKKHTQ